MDNETNELLREIANELRARNEMLRAQQVNSDQMRREFREKAEAARTEMMARSGAEIQAITGKTQEATQARISSMSETAEQERRLRHEFQASLLAELRKLNENFERHLARDV